MTAGTTRPSDRCPSSTSIPERSSTPNWRPSRRWMQSRPGPGRVCPLVCNHGFKADGDACMKIACRAGYRVNDDNECEKVQEKRPMAERDPTNVRDADRKKDERAPAKQQSSGQMFCNQAGC